MVLMYLHSRCISWLTVHCGAVDFFHSTLWSSSPIASIFIVIHFTCVTRNQSPLRQDACGWTDWFATFTLSDAVNEWEFNTITLNYKWPIALSIDEEVTTPRVPLTWVSPLITSHSLSLSRMFISLAIHLTPIESFGCDQSIFICIWILGERERKMIGHLQHEPQQRMGSTRSRELVRHSDETTLYPFEDECEEYEFWGIEWFRDLLLWCEIHDVLQQA